MSRLIATLVLALMVLPALVVLIPSTDAQAVAGRSDATGFSFTEANGITLRTMTNVDMAKIRINVGTRIEGVNYDVVVDGYHTGLAPPSSESWEKMVGNVLLAQIPKTLRLSAPPAYDMSTNSWFPIVGNQGGQGSCAAWAATYYCYGAIEAKDNGWTGSKIGNSAQLLSPAWTYNRVVDHGDPEGGSWMSENFEVIRDWGVPTLATFPYTDSNDINWGDEAAWREAPLHRGSEVVFLGINGDMTVDAIKNLVATDQPVTFAIDSSQFSISLADDYVISADEYNPNGNLTHAMTIVGYDDSKVATGHSDVGAFRIVNSWGASWKDHGFCWISYDAFKEIMNEKGNELSYITDISDYIPSLLAIWHYNSPPKRDVEHILAIGNPSSYLDTKTPYWYSDPTNVLPSFMACDISEFRSYYDSGTTNFSLEVIGGVDSVISSFRVESYQDGYSPGAPTQVSAQSSQVPRITPGRVETNFPSYSPISAAQALDRTGIDVSNPGLTDWVGISQTHIYGDSAMQAGDVGDSSSSVIQVNVTGYAGISFFWKVSSEQSADYLRFYESSTQKMEISGDSGWVHVWYNFTDLGTHILKWSYEKNGANSSLQDSAWIDRLQLLIPDDSFEPNDVSAQASVLTAPGNFSGLVLQDNDWYMVNLSTGDTLRATARFNGSVGDLSIFLYATDSMTLLDSSTHASGDVESVLVANVFDAGYYYLKLIPVNCDSINYSLQLDRFSDTTPPITNVSFHGHFGSNGWYDSAVNVVMIPNDIGSGINVTRYLVNSSPWANYNGVFQINDSGQHLIEYYSTDRAGNVEAIKKVTLKIDTTDPVSSANLVGSIGSNGWYVTTVQVNLNASDEISGISAIIYRLDGLEERTYIEALVVSAEGSHTLHYYSVDVAGNIENEHLLQFKIDAVAPESLASINGSVGEGGWYTSAVELTTIAKDNTSGVSLTFISLDSDEWRLYSSQIAVDQCGTHHLEFYSKDRAGNIESVKLVDFRVDFDVPTILIQKDGRIFTTGEVRLNWTASDNTSQVSTIELSIDGKPFQIFSGTKSNITLQSLTDGQHSVAIRVTDFAGNNVIKVLSFTIDTNPFSPQGPFGSTLLIGTVLAVALFVDFVILLFRRR